MNSSRDMKQKLLICYCFDNLKCSQRAKRKSVHAKCITKIIKRSDYKYNKQRKEKEADTDILSICVNRILYSCAKKTNHLLFLLFLFTLENGLLLLLLGSSSFFFFSFCNLRHFTLHPIILTNRTM